MGCLTVGRRRILVGLACASAVLAGSGCGPASESDRAEESARAAMAEVAEEFLEAVEAGDGPGALALLEFAGGDVPCQAVIDGYTDVPDRPRDASVKRVVVGDLEKGRGIVAVTYRQGSGRGKTDGTLEMVRRGDGFAVDVASMPEGALTVGASLGFGVKGFLWGLRTTVDGQCPVSDLDMRFTVLPGTYTVEVTDPSGVLEAQSGQVTAGLASDRGGYGSSAFLAVDSEVPDGLQTEVGEVLARLAEECAESRFAGPTCPADVRAFAVEVPKTGDVVRVGKVEEVGILSLAQDEDGTWHAHSITTEFEYRPAGAWVSAIGRYEGAVSRDAAGNIAIDLDDNGKGSP